MTNRKPITEQDEEDEFLRELKATQEIGESDVSFEEMSPYKPNIEREERDRLEKEALLKAKFEAQQAAYSVLDEKAITDKIIDDFENQDFDDNINDEALFNGEF